MKSTVSPWCETEEKAREYAEQNADNSEFVIQVENFYLLLLLECMVRVIASFLGGRKSSLSWFNIRKIIEINDILSLESIQSVGRIKIDKHLNNINIHLSCYTLFLLIM